MQALCQWEAQQDETSEALQAFLLDQERSHKTRQYATTLVDRYWSHRGEIDKRIGTASREWQLSRISTVERNVLRVGVVELELAAVPPKVTINEAIEIAREFGAAASPGFVNGVLDQIHKTLQKPLGNGE